MRRITHHRPGRPLALAALLFAVACAPALAAGDPPPDPVPVDSLLRSFVSLHIVPEHPCAGDSITLQLQTNGCPACFHLTSFGFRNVTGAHIEGTADWTTPCNELRCAPETLSTPLGRHASGSFVLSVPMFVLIHRLPQPDTTVSFTMRLEFQVGPPCGTPPPPPPLDSLARNLVRFAVAPAHRCPGDSLSLLMFKNGCPPCVHLTSLALEPGAGGFHATLEWRPNCLELVCQPETLSTPLGAFAAGHFVLAGQVDVTVHREAGADSIVSYRTRVAFDVPAACDTTSGPCMPPFLVVGAGRVPGCQLTLQPGQEGDLTLSALPPVPLGGFQGLISCTAPFRVYDVRAAAGSHGLHVTTVREGRGVRYVVFTDPHSPIPAAPTPVLDLEVIADFGALAGSQGSLLPLVTLAADAKGDSVQVCDDLRGHLGPAIELCVSGDASGCDANGDGRLDVRDLVKLVGCLRQVLFASGTNDTLRCTDCNGDSLFDIRDILCCARAILHGPPVPRDSVHASDVRVSLVALGSGERSAVLRVRVTGLRGLGALMMRLDYPGDRWQAGLPFFPLSKAPDPAIASGSWMPVLDVGEEGHIYFGGINPGDATADELSFDVQFIASQDPQPGDRVDVAIADLAASDGSPIAPKGTLPSFVFGSPVPPPPLPTDIALSAAHPNPVTIATRFTVLLPRAADIDLAVHDVAGRRVATLARGSFDAGRHDFTWDGAGARGGLYFVRLTVEGRVFSSRVVLLRNPN